MKGLLAALVALVAFALPAAARAQFEGRLEYTMSAMPGAKPAAAGSQAGGGGTVTAWIGSGGMRSESHVKMTIPGHGEHEMNTISIFRKAEPDRTYFVNEERKTYTVIEASKEGDADDTWKVEKVGSATVAGYPCERARFTREGSGHMELCVTQKLGTLPLAALQGQRTDRGLPGALVRAGLNGVPVRWSSVGKDSKEEFVMELVSAHKEKVPASKFEIPSGYTKAEGLGGMTNMTPEQSKQMDEAMKQMQEQMKKMTPEQRKQMEDMMKQYGGKPPGGN